MTDEMARNVAAFEQTVRSTIALAETFDGPEWDLPTDCPGWTVKDVCSHLVSLERMLLGEPLPDHTLPEDLPYVRNDLGRMVEIGVDVRRTVPGGKVLGELREAIDRRMAALPGIDPEQPTIAPTGRTVTYAQFMAFRAFDCWVHEQDIRHAVDRPGNVDAPAAACARSIMQRGLPLVVGKKAAATPGQSVTFDITGPTGFRANIQVGDDGRAREVDAVPNPTATLQMDWGTYARLSAGRCSAADVDVSISGDNELADRVLANMAVTP